MGDYYGQLTYSDSFDAESEVKEIKENLEANGKQIECMNSNFQKQKCAIIFGFFNLLFSSGFIIYLYLQINGFTPGPNRTGTVSNAPIGTILAWVPKPEKTSSNAVSIPDGWMPCDGSIITQGPWKGGRTPDLNTVGAFLRGGTEDLVLEKEEDQIRDHEHSCSATADNHDHSYYAARQDDSDGQVCGVDGNCDDSDTLVYTESRRTESARVSVSCSVNGVSSGRVGSETRPINMKVIYIIRVY